MDFDWIDFIVQILSSILIGISSLVLLVLLLFEHKKRNQKNEERNREIIKRQVEERELTKK